MFILIILGEDYKLWSFSLCKFSPKSGCLSKSKFFICEGRPVVQAWSLEICFLSDKLASYVPLNTSSVLCNPSQSVNLSLVLFPGNEHGTLIYAGLHDLLRHSSPDLAVDCSARRFINLRFHFVLFFRPSK
jgi:hypothetical protein